MDLVIVGLGNPGERYSHTLHNVGFKVVEEMANKNGWSWQYVERFKAYVAKGRLKGETYHLLKPSSYMNLSGEAVCRYLNYYQLGVKQLVIVVDDADLPLGELRMKPFGGSGGHNGLKSLEKELQTNGFKRLKVGIGRSPLLELADYVLAPQSKELWALLAAAIQRAEELLERLAYETFEDVMKAANTKT